ncbi:hypothetical protein AA313_de0207115 [Arthrobotrys entomopaga]|nr:hypothetical protein AA313_de0207115 [Arthrobotrys entomopaga]
MSKPKLANFQTRNAQEVTLSDDCLHLPQQLVQTFFNRMLSILASLDLSIQEKLDICTGRCMQGLSTKLTQATSIFHCGVRGGARRDEQTLNLKKLLISEVSHCHTSEPRLTPPHVGF